MASDFERANEVDRDLDPFICKLERGGYVKDDFLYNYSNIQK